MVIDRRGGKGLCFFKSLHFDCKGFVRCFAFFKQSGVLSNGGDGSARRELFGVLARVWGILLDCKGFVRRFASFKQSGVLSNGGGWECQEGTVWRVGACVGHSPLIARVLCAALRPLSSLVSFPMGGMGVPGGNCLACWRVCGAFSLIARVLCAALRPLSSLVFFPMGWDGSARRELFGVLARVWGILLDCKGFVRRFAFFKQSGVLSNGVGWECQEGTVWRVGACVGGILP
ncbi:hypothetical protein [Bartonella tribocorum]|uniref:hypothetical protein n=1 Tax=Bartonella tribocorum TaxID=85701 RepID=UPI00043B0A41|nr:hypothetical protein [Bartonella tribocorum]CDO49564.1 hypothetical protein BM1374166_01920 [Bartonella tribocorum]